MSTSPHTRRAHASQSSRALLSGQACHQSGIGDRENMLSLPYFSGPSHCPFPCALHTGSGAGDTPFYDKIFYYKIVSMELCNIAISQSTCHTTFTNASYMCMCHASMPLTVPTNHTRASLTSARPCILVETSTYPFYQ